MQAYVVSLDKGWTESQKNWARMFTRKHWHLEQILDHVPAEVSVQALMDLQVNDMDPDFSFTKWYGDHCCPPDKPVPEMYTE